MMKEFIECVAKFLVDHPEDVSVEESITEEQKHLLTLKVNKDDIGKVIGRQGKTIQAIRTLLSAVSAKERKRAILNIMD
jgi:hypothetical protein